MSQIPFEHFVWLCVLLFSIGLFGVLTRRNLLMLFLGIELMLNASALLFVGAGSKFNQVDGQIMFLFVITVAAVEACVALALILQMHRLRGTLNVSAATLLKE